MGQRISAAAAKLWVFLGWTAKAAGPFSSLGPTATYKAAPLKCRRESARAMAAALIAWTPPARWGNTATSTSSRKPFSPPPPASGGVACWPATPNPRTPQPRFGGGNGQSSFVQQPSMTAREMMVPAAVGNRQPQGIFDGKPNLRRERHSTPELNLAIACASRANRLHPPEIPDRRSTYAALPGKRCVAVHQQTAPSSWGGGQAKAAVASPNPIKHVLLPVVMSKEPLHPASIKRRSPLADAEFRWTVYALFQPEELGITRRTLAEKLARSQSQQTNRPTCAASLVWKAISPGKQLGLPADFVVQAVTARGQLRRNLFERQRGRASALKLEEIVPKTGNGPTVGLIYSPPFR